MMLHHHQNQESATDKKHRKDAASRSTTDRRRSTSRAFTIVELIISVTILAITVTSVFSLIIFTINLNAQNLLKVQALELSREGMELVRNVRDTGWKNNQKFITYLEGGTWKDLPLRFTIEPNLSDPTADPINIRPFTGALSDPPTRTQAAPLRLDYLTSPIGTPPRDAVLGIAHSSFLSGRRESPFYRVVRFEPATSSDLPIATTAAKTEAYRVTVTVFYEFSGKLRKMEMTQVLTDWRKV